MFEVNSNQNDWNKVENILEKKKEHTLHHEGSLRALVEETKGIHRAAFIVLHHRAFEFVVGAAIFANLGLVILETDAVAQTNEVPSWVNWLSWMILIIFLVEMALRLYVWRWKFWIDGFNVFDFFLVVTDTFLNIFGHITKTSISFLRIVRLCRLVRSIKAISMFPELRTLLAGLSSSLRPIFWGSMLLVFTLLVFAILAVQFIHPIAKDLYVEGKFDCGRGDRAYSTVFHSFLTLTQHFIMGDSWGCVSIPIVEEYPSSAIFYAAVLIVVVMLVLNLILGVVVDAASQARNAMLGEMRDEKLIERLEVHCHLLDICKTLDGNDDGEISKEEILKGYQENETFRNALAYMEVSDEDLDVLWTCLDADKSGSVTFEEFVSSCYKMKSSNTHFLLAHIKYYVTVIKNTLLDQLELMNKSILSEEQQLAKELMSEERKIEQTLESSTAVLAKQTIMQSEIEGIAENQGKVYDQIKVPETKFGSPTQVGRDSPWSESDELTRFITSFTQDLKDFMGGKKNKLLEQKRMQSNDASDLFPDGTSKQLWSDGGCTDELQTCIALLRDSNRQKAELRTTIQELSQRLEGTPQHGSSGFGRGRRSAESDAWQLPVPLCCTVSDGRLPLRQV